MLYLIFRGKINIPKHQVGSERKGIAQKAVPQTPQEIWALSEAAIQVAVERIHR